MLENKFPFHLKQLLAFTIFCGSSIKSLGNNIVCILHKKVSEAEHPFIHKISEGHKVLQTLLQIFITFIDRLLVQDVHSFFLSETTEKNSMANHVLGMLAYAI